MKKLLPFLFLISAPAYADITQKFTTSAQITVDMPYSVTNKLGTTYSITGTNITPSVTSGGSTTANAIGGLNVGSRVKFCSNGVGNYGRCDTISSYSIIRNSSTATLRRTDNNR